MHHITVHRPFQYKLETNTTSVFQCITQIGNQSIANTRNKYITLTVNQCITQTRNKCITQTGNMCITQTGYQYISHLHRLGTSTHYRDLVPDYIKACVSFGLLASACLLHTNHTFLH